MPGDKGELYYRKFWRPFSEDFGTPQGQASYRGKKE